MHFYFVFTVRIARTRRFLSGVLHGKTSMLYATRPHDEQKSAMFQLHMRDGLDDVWADL